MDLLARREHSRLELQRKLRRRYDADEIGAALATLSEEGLQSDQRFAESFARERMQRGFGPVRIERELLQRGVTGRETDAALRNLVHEEGINWRRVAEAALRKKFGDADMPDDYPERARRLRFLQQRGFATDDFG